MNDNDLGQFLYQSADAEPEFEKPSEGTIVSPEPDTYAVDENQDYLPPITMGMYRVFMAKGRAGMHALTVYMHLLFTYRLQKTDHVYATNNYLQRGLCMGIHMVEHAKSLLREMGHIETIKRKDSTTGKIIKTYNRIVGL